MKNIKHLSMVLYLMLMAALLISCSSKGKTSSSDIADLNDGKTRICLLINGQLGDMSFFDSANEGMTKFAGDHPEVDVKIVEIGTDTSKWEPTLRQTANDSYDLIIVCTSEMKEPLQRLVKMQKYADRRFIIFDAEIEDGKAANYPTVHSMMFKQNEGGYLAGALAALISKDMGVNTTGFIGGMQIDIINDFGYGFMQGVNKANTEFNQQIKAYNSYIGDFSNSTKGKSLADTMYDQGVEVLFAAASQAGLGCLDSAKNNDKLIIGVDSDQFGYFKDTDVKKADRIVTSILKRVDLALYEACEAFLNNTLEYGTLVNLGINEGKVGIVENDNYKAKVSEETRTYISQIIMQIKDGSLVVESGLKRHISVTDLNAYIDSLKPNEGN